MRTSSAVALWLFVISSLAGPSITYAQTQVVDLSTCVTSNGSLGNVGAFDPKWQVKIPSSNFQPVKCTNGSLISGSTVFPNVWASAPQARWISPYVDSAGNATSPGAATGDFIYRMTFVAPDCRVSSATVTLAKLGGDNTVTKLTITNPHTLNATFSPLTSTSINIPPGEITPGTNTIDVTVNNQSSFTGLFIAGNLTITYPGCPSVGVNKDLKNNTGHPANDIEILLAGSHTNLNHYDGYPANRFASYTESPAPGGNTLLKWSNPNNPVQPGQIAHVGFNLLGSTIHILGVSWTWNGKKTGCAEQVSTNTHLWGSPGSQVIYGNNGLSCISVPRYVGELKVEWYAQQVPLADLNAQSRRNPLRIDVIRKPPVLLKPGATARVDVPQAPPEATFGVVVHKVSRNPSLTGPDVTTDFLEFPVVRGPRRCPPGKVEVAFPGTDLKYCCDGKPGDPRLCCTAQEPRAVGENPQ